MQNLHGAAKVGDVQLIKEYLENSSTVNINDKNTAGDTALAISIKENNCECAELLISHGTDVSLINK
eukprot:Pgem_evm1s9369